MQNEEISPILKSLFHISIPNEELEGGYIEDSKIYKTIRALIPLPQSVQSEIEMYCFNFAIKTIAIEFSQRENHGLYIAENYLHLFENQFSNINFEDLVSLCYYHFFLVDFKHEYLTFDYEKGVVYNNRTNEVISINSIECLIFRLINYELTIQINYVKMILNISNKRKELIDLIAGSNKEEYIESATKLFNDLMEGNIEV